MHPITMKVICLRVTVVLVVVVPVVELRMEVMVVKGVRVRLVKVLMVPDRDKHGTPVVVGVLVKRVTVGMVRLIVIQQ